VAKSNDARRIGLLDDAANAARRAIWPHFADAPSRGVDPSNIAEGEGRGTDGHLLHALSVSYGSLRELETQLLLSGRLRFLSEQDLRGLFDQCEEVGRILNGLMKTVKNRIRAKRMTE